MGIAQVGERVDVEVGGRVDGGIEHEAEVAVPVAVDVLRTGNRTAGLGVEGGLIRHGITGRREVHEGHHGTLVLLEVIVVEEVEILRERGLQTRVTTRDAQRIAIVDDIKQVAHRRLLGTATIGEAQLTSLRLLPTEVEGRRDIGHSAHGIGIDALIVLDEVRLLGKHLETDVEVIGLTDDAQHQLKRMVVILVFRVSAQVLVLIGIYGFGKPGKIGIPVAVLWHDITVVHTDETIHETVALGIAIIIGITELQVDLSPEGLAVGGTDAVAPFVLRRDTVAVGDRRIGSGEQVYVIVRYRLADAITPVAVQLHGDVAARVVQAAVELQHTTHALRIAVADTVTNIVVLGDALADQGLDLGQGVIDIVIRIL